LLVTGPNGEHTGMSFGLAHQGGKSIAGGTSHAAYQYFRHRIGALTVAGKYRRFAGPEPNCI